MVALIVRMGRSASQVCICHLSGRKTETAVVNTRPITPRMKSRIVGACYLFTIAVGAFDHIVVGGRITVAGDAPATVHNLLAFAPLYRLAFALDLIPIYAIVTVLLYELFTPVSASLSRFAAYLSLAGGVIGSTTSILQLAPLEVLTDASHLQGFTALQLQDLTLILLRLHALGFAISLMFFGGYCFLLGWMSLGLSMIGRYVGTLLAVGGLAYALYSFAYFASPAFAASLAGYALTLGSLGEVTLTLWLLVIGVDTARWKA
jgi:hypothetical protein